MLTYQLIHALLDDDHGISSEAYDALLNWLACHKNGSPELADRMPHEMRSFLVAQLGRIHSVLEGMAEAADDVAPGCPLRQRREEAVVAEVSIHFA